MPMPYEMGREPNHGSRPISFATKPYADYLLTLNLNSTIKTKTQ